MRALLGVALSAAAGYLLGAIPTGMVVGKVGGVDLTQVGSRRTGATNVLRTLGPWPAAFVFAADFAKGAVAVRLARALLDDGSRASEGSAWAQVVAATAAVVGHSYSPFIGWRGGRGVVAAAGGVTVIHPLATLFGASLGGAVIALTRYVSLGSLTATLVSASIVLARAVSARQSTAYYFYVVIVPAFIIFGHRDNISRLLNGIERKLGERVAGVTSDE